MSRNFWNINSILGVLCKVCNFVFCDMNNDTIYRFKWLRLTCLLISLISNNPPAEHYRQLIPSILCKMKTIENMTNIISFEFLWINNKCTSIKTKCLSFPILSAYTILISRTNGVLTDTCLAEWSCCQYWTMSDGSKVFFLRMDVLLYFNLMLITTLLSLPSDHFPTVFWLFATVWPFGCYGQKKTFLYRTFSSDTG